MKQKTVAKNTAYMMIASIGQKIISLTYFTIIARTLGAEKTGTYTAALAMTTIFVVFVDLGFTNVFIREAAKAREKIQEYFSNVLFGKIFFGVLSYIGLAIMLQILGFDADFQMLVFLSGVTMLFDSLHLTIYGAFRAYGNLKYEAVGIVGSQFITLVLGTTFLYLGLPLIYLILAFTVAAACNVVYSMYIARSRYDLHIVPKYNKKIFKTIAAIAVPFALAAIFGRIYSYADVILLKKLAGDTQVGFYSTPSKISFAFQFIPLALVAGLYPRFSELYAHNKKKLSRLFEQSVIFLMLIALPISIGIFTLAEDIVLFVFTDKFIHSIGPLKILVVSLLFSFLSFPIGALLNACNRQKAQTVITAIILFANIFANMFLIPIYGAVGAAYSALLANILLSVLGYFVIPQITKVAHGRLFGRLIQIGISVSVMGIAVAYVNQFTHFLYAIVVGALVYSIMLFVTKAVNKAQILELFALVRR